METVGKYEVVKKIASGGMAEVFLVKLRGPEGFEKLFALKMIIPSLAANREFLERFLDEARLAAYLIHPNIVQIFELGQSNGNYFIVMEYIEGESLYGILSRLTSKGAQMPWEVAVKIASDVLGALDYAHNYKTADGKHLNIIHRDVSPQNVMISSLGVVKLLDFGIAKAATNVHHTRSNFVSGKAPYMSPEYLVGKRIDRRADIFSLGVVLYEMCTRQKPFTGTSEYEISSSIVYDKPVRPKVHREDLPDKAEQIIMGAIEKNPLMRFRDAAEMLERLSSLMHEAGRITDNFELGKFVKTAMGDGDTQIVIGEQRTVTDRATLRKLDREEEAGTGPEEQRGEQEEETTANAEGRALQAKAAASGKAAAEGRQWKPLITAVAVFLTVTVIAAIFMVGGFRREESKKAVAAADKNGKPAQLQDNRMDFSPLSVSDRKFPAPPVVEPGPAIEAAKDEQPVVKETALKKKDGKSKARDKRKPYKPPKKKPVKKTAAASPVFGTLTITADPQAEVIINGVSRGWTPVTIQVREKGSHRIALDNAGKKLHFEKVLDLPLRGDFDMDIEIFSSGKIAYKKPVR